MNQSMTFKGREFYKSCTSGFCGYCSYYLVEFFLSLTLSLLIFVSFSFSVSSLHILQMYTSTEPNSNSLSLSRITRTTILKMLGALKERGKRTTNLDDKNVYLLTYSCGEFVMYANPVNQACPGRGVR